MGSKYFNFALIQFFVPFCFFLLLHTTVYAQDDVCTRVDCVRGTCVGNKSAMLGFDCICYSGWKQFTWGAFTLPPCVIPDCKLDFHCGSSAPAPPPPPPSPPPPFNLLDPCIIAWCGDGTCQPDGISHSCQCFQGSANLFNMTVLPCFKKCGIGADCNAVDLGPHSTLTPPQSNGSTSTSRCSRPFSAVNIGLICAIIFVSIINLHGPY